MSDTHSTEFEMLASQKPEELNSKKDYHAIIKIYDFPSMNSYLKSKLIYWMRELADSIEKEEKQEDFNDIFTARMMK